MDTGQLEAFLAVCRLRNFTKAADFLHISQSAVTARIKALEHTTGKPLLNRDKRSVSLTPAGLSFMTYAERMLHLYEESLLSLEENFEHHITMSGPGVVWHYRYLNHILSDLKENANVKLALELLSVTPK